MKKEIGALPVPKVEKEKLVHKEQASVSVD